jgi:hypothetical protein
VGASTGIFETWNEVDPLVTGYPGSRHKVFSSLEAAEAWYKNQMEWLASEEQELLEQARAEHELAAKVEQLRLTRAHIASRNTVIKNHVLLHTATGFDRGGDAAPTDYRVRGGGPAPGLPVVGNTGRTGHRSAGATQPSGVRAASGFRSTTRAQAEMERVRKQELYNSTYYGNPHGPDNLSPGSMHPHRLVLPEINAGHGAQPWRLPRHSEHA